MLLLLVPVVAAVLFDAAADATAGVRERVTGTLSKHVRKLRLNAED